MVHLFYIGTKKECEAYNALVNSSENYTDGTVWAEIKKHPTKYTYAVLSNSKYVLEGKTARELTEDWL